MILLLVTTAIAGAHFAFRRFESGVTTYPDSIRFLRAGSGLRLHRPFHLRWLLPFVLGSNETAWTWVTGIATVALAPLTMLWLESLGLPRYESFVGSLLVPGLAGVFRMNATAASLVDAPALALILGSATMFNHDLVVSGVVLAVVAACVKESSPLFTALLSQSFYPLLGLVPVAVRQLTYRSNDADIFDERSLDILLHPLKYGLEFHRDKWFEFD